MIDGPFHGIKEVVHFAAETHVDRSIMGSGPFVQANVVGTQVLLDISRAKAVEKFVLVSKRASTEERELKEDRT